MKRLRIEPYGATLYITTSRKAWRKKYKKMGGDPHAADCSGLCAHFGPKYLVGVFKGGVDTLVHELTHVCMFEAQRTRFHIDNSNDEALAYLMGSLAGRCIKALPKILEQS